MLKPNVERRMLSKSVTSQRVFLFKQQIIRRADVRTELKLRQWVKNRKYVSNASDMAKVAEDIGVSALQLSYYFRVVIGKPFLSWRKEIRIQEAQSLLLLHPDKSISSIGEMVGINDKSNFRKQFLEVVGMTPADYRRILFAKPEKE